jgi:hypothetical protein
MEVRKFGGAGLISDFACCRVVGQTDVAEFMSLGPSDSVADLAAALDLVRGEFLEDFTINSEPWSEWQTRERESFRDMAANVGVKLAGLASAAGEHDVAIGAARRAVHMDGLSEAAHRALMRAYEAAGRRGEAVRQFEICSRSLRSELAVPPDPATLNLCREIRSGTGLAERRPESSEGMVVSPVSRKFAGVPLSAAEVAIERLKWKVETLKISRDSCGRAIRAGNEQLAAAGAGGKLRRSLVVETAQESIAGGTLGLEILRILETPVDEPAELVAA